MNEVYEVIGIQRGNKKADNTPYEWIYILDPLRNSGEGCKGNQIFLRKHTNTKVGDMVELVSTFSNGRVYINDVRVID